jgi:mannose-6-phosphate isomerase-like protein (cupin superfamily)
VRRVKIVREEDLPLDGTAHELIGEQHGDVGVSVIFSRAAPGRGPSLHTHPYAELLILVEGTARVFTGDEERDISAGDIVVVEPGEPHGFVNTGDAPLRQIDIHASPRFVTEWLDRVASDG